jgi:hypothetical protein
MLYKFGEFDLLFEGKPLGDEVLLSETGLKNKGTLNLTVTK